MSKARKFAIWAGLALVILVPLIAAAYSPQLQYRQPIYIAAGFAGIAAFGMLLVQPLLIAGFLPGLNPRTSRKTHRIIGALLVIFIVLHIAGLWITSPPDVVDALLFRSPTPFSLWGVIAMWAIFATATIAAFRRKLKLPLRTWRVVHILLAIIIVAGTIAHALLIDGTMETLSKVALSMMVGAAALKIVSDAYQANRRR